MHEFFQPRWAILFAVFGHANTSHFDVFFVPFLLASGNRLQSPVLLDDPTLWIILLPLCLVLLARELIWGFRRGVRQFDVSMLVFWSRHLPASLEPFFR
jgi:hypothetical protein